MWHLTRSTLHGTGSNGGGMSMEEAIEACANAEISSYVDTKEDRDKERSYRKQPRQPSEPPTKKQRQQNGVSNGVINIDLSAVGSTGVNGSSGVTRAQQMQLARAHNVARAVVAELFFWH